MKRVHFIGIGGIGMSSLAQYFLSKGYTVTGSDRVEGEETIKLREKGAHIHIGHDANNLDRACFAVYSHAIDRDNCEVERARQEGIPLFGRDIMLGQVFNSFSTRIAVAGAHGKTTTCAMLLSALCECGISPTALVGGNVPNIGNFYSGKDDVVIAEACEYKNSFLYLKPTISVVLNIEHDHPDFFRSKSSVTDSFARFVSNTDKAGYLVYNGDTIPSGAFSSPSIALHSVGRCKHNNYTVEQITPHRDGFGFLCKRKNHTICTVAKVCFPLTNIDNACAVIAVCDLLGLSAEKVSQSLTKFEGVSRRFERVKNEGAEVLLDYAHHPTQIRNVIQSIAQQDNLRGVKRNITVIFQPHTYSRTKALLTEFATCFADADRVYILPTYGARESERDGATHLGLAERIRQLKYVPCSLLDSFAQAVEIIKECDHTHTVLLLGAGDIAQVAKMLN